MDVMSAFSGVSHSVRVLADLVKANKSLTNFNELIAAVSEVNAQLIRAQEAVFAAHEKLSALNQCNAELEKEIVELKNWDREAERYELNAMAPGVPAYVLKSEIQHSTRTHYLCANCFSDHKKSFLQTGPAYAQHGCARCKGQWFARGSGGTEFGVAKLVRS